MANISLGKAKRVKNDEFYTKIEDIEKELLHYKKHFKDKIIFCNCDDPKESNFFKYFAQNFSHFGLKKLITTHYHKSKPTYKLEITGDMDNNGKIDKNDVIKTKLKQNGDFRSPECIEFLKEADIVVTNPPFSLFREYMEQLMEYKKDFLIIGNMNAITYKEVFPLIKENKIWLGFTSPKEFIQPNGDIKKFGNVLWFTNLDHNKRHEKIILYKKYNPEEYLKYDNYDAIEVSKVSEVPYDYNETMGVPITFLDKFNPDQFKIIGLDRYTVKKEDLVGGRLTVDNKIKYARILIKRKDKNEN